MEILLFSESAKLFLLIVSFLQPVNDKLAATRRNWWRIFYRRSLKEVKRGKENWLYYFREDGKDTPNMSFV